MFLGACLIEIHQNINYTYSHELRSYYVPSIVPGVFHTHRHIFIPQADAGLRQVLQTEKLRTVPLTLGDGLLVGKFDKKQNIL